MGVRAYLVFSPCKLFDILELCIEDDKDEDDEDKDDKDNNGKDEDGEDKLISMRLDYKVSCINIYLFQPEKQNPQHFI